MRKPNLLGFNPDAVAGIMDYYEATMADTNIVAGIDRRRSIFNAAVRGLNYHKVVGEDEFVSDGYTCIIGGIKRRFEEMEKDIRGKRFNVYEVEKDNYLLGMGLEQMLGFLLEWNMNDDLIKVFADRGLSHEMINFLRNNRKLDLTVEAIPEGIPIFGHEPYISVEGTFEKVQFPESLLLGTWGYQTAVATQASYVKNILEEFGRQNTLTLEGGSRRIYPACSLAATRAILSAGFTGTSLVEIAKQYPELLYKPGGSAGHSQIIHIGNDEEAFELQTRAYYGIKEGDSEAIIKEKIKQVSRKGIGPTYLIDTFDSSDGLEAAIRVMKKYGIQSQIRDDSDIRSEKEKFMRNKLDKNELEKARIMLSGDLKPWVIYELLKDGAVIDTILMGTYLVNPYKLPGAAYKIAADQRDRKSPQIEYRCKICKNEPAKGTYPGPLDVFRIIGRDGKADRDVILLRGVDSIDSFMKKTDEDKIKLNKKVMEYGEINYDIPDMCTLIENTAYHLSLLRPEYRRFRNAEEYPVVISPNVKKAKNTFAKRFETGRL